MRYVVVDGNIGAGKSTLLANLCGAPGVRVVPEPIERWCSPFSHRGESVPAPLELLYRDPGRNSLAFQMHIITTRVQQMLRVRDECAGDGDGVVLVLERDPFDTELFVEDKYLTGEFDAFHHRAFTELAETLRGCFDMERVGGVYLRLNPEACVQRIRERGREAEAGLDADRLESLHRLHEVKYADADRDARLLVVDARADAAEIARLVADHVCGL